MPWEQIHFENIKWCEGGTCKVSRPPLSITTQCALSCGLPPPSRSRETWLSAMGEASHWHAPQNKSAINFYLFFSVRLRRRNTMFSRKDYMPAIMQKSLWIVFRFVSFWRVCQGDYTLGNVATSLGLPNFSRNLDHVLIGTSWEWQSKFRSTQVFYFCCC